MLPTEVYAPEVAAINTRRARYGLPLIDRQDQGPNVEHGLVGLAFSGGGIRSATVNIGLLQGLGKGATLERFDYLSTVSGGGFAGGCLSASLKTAPRREAQTIRIEGLPEQAVVEGAQRDAEGGWLVDVDTPASQAIRINVQMPRTEAEDLCVIRASAAEGALKAPLSVSIEDVDEVLWRKTCVDGEAWGLIIDKAPDTKIVLTVARETFPFAFRRPPQRPESAALQHLREHADYLKPHSAFSALRIPALFIMGFVTNLFVLLPWLLLIAAITYAGWSPQIQHALCTNSSDLLLDGSAFDNGSYELHLARFAVPPESCQQSAKPLSDEHTTWVNLINVPIGAVGQPEKCEKLSGDRTHSLFSCTAKDPVFKITLDAFDDPFRDTLELTVRTWSGAKPPSVFEGARSDAGVIANDIDTDPISALTASTFDIVFMFVWALVLLMIVYPLLKTPPTWRARDQVTRVVFGIGLTSVVVIAGFEMQPLGTYYFASVAGAPEKGNLIGGFGELALTLTVSITIIGGLIARSSVAKSFGRVVLMYGVALVGFLTLWLLSQYFTLWLLDCNHIPGMQWLKESWVNDSLQLFFDALNQPFIPMGAWTQCSLYDPSSELVVLFVVVAVVLILITKVWFNVNKTSFHHFYRDRLSRAFSIDPWGDDAEHNDVMPLAELATDRGPFHILNTTLNLPHTKVGSLKGRGCDFFVFTPNHSGSQLTGYVRTAEYTASEPGFDLNSAMAVSGAAAAPTMGVYTNRALVFLMALLNVRLDFWAHNPKLHRGRKVRQRTIGAFYLLREMFGALDEDSEFVNLSDGGHIENLGVYELIRRHCRLIICSDCQADEHMMFDGLADLIRLVRIDMGIEIDIDVSPLVRAEKGKRKGLSTSHYAVGTIHYPEGDGVFIILKTSLTGDEGLYIENYRSDHPTFPNETTADQFFDEPQFEAYRALGQHIALDFLQSDHAQAWLERDQVDVEKITRADEVERLSRN